MMRTRPRRPAHLHDLEASHVVVEAMHGAVSIQVRRDMYSDREAGYPMPRMFLELSMCEAREHHRKLGEAIAKAGQLGSSTRGEGAAAGEANAR